MNAAVAESDPSFPPNPLPSVSMPAHRSRNPSAIARRPEVALDAAGVMKMERRSRA